MELDKRLKSTECLEPVTRRSTQSEGSISIIPNVRELPTDRFNLWSTIGVQFGVTASPLAIGIFLQLVTGAGGSPYFFWCLLVAMTGQFLICFSLAELSSVYPHTAGTTYWVTMLASPAQARFLSYINGMATCLAFILATCGTLIYTGTFIVELGVVVSPSYTIELWHIYLCSVGVIIISILFNTYWIKAMPHMTSFSVVFINAATVFIFVTLLVKTHPKASASTVFLDVQNSTGWSSDGLVFLIALLPGGMVISMFDTAAHLAEELPHPERQVWQVMILTNIMNAVTTIAMCLALLFCLTQPENLLEPLGGMPILQLCWDAWPNKGFLVTVVICYLLMNVFATTSLLFAASRVIWSFSKTGAFPFSSWMSNVNSRLQVPSNSVIFTGVVVVSIGLLVLGPQTVQNGLFGAAGIFFTIAYLMPIILLLKKGRASIPASRSFNMGRVGPIVNIFACGWGVMLTVFLCFPMYIPISLSTMNWTSVCAVGFAFLALGNWFLVRKKYQLLHGLYVE